MHRPPVRIVVAFFALLCAVGVVAYAQDPPPPPPPEEAQPPEEKPAEAEEPTETFGEEIKVTAMKREQAIQEVPMSVAAPTEELLRSRGVEDLEGISQNVAGLQVQNLGPGQSQIAMRGVSAGQIVRDQPGVKEQVGVYLDESVISLSLFTPDIDLFDLSRVEVLRGPQGTLFGSGSLTGTVRYITNQPELGVQSTTADIAASSGENEFGGNAKVAINVPMGDAAALRVAAYYTSYGGFVEAVQPGGAVNEGTNDGDRAGARVSMLFKPNDRLTITPRIIYQEVDMDGWNRTDTFNILANEFTTTRPQVELGDRRQFTQFEEPYTDEFMLADLNINYDFGDLALTSITSYTDRDILVVRDATALTASITGGSIGLPENIYTLDAPLDDATDIRVFTEELRLAGDAGRLDWVTGIFYSTIDRSYGQSLFVDGFEDLSGIPTAGTRGAGKDILFFSDLDYKFDQVALFGEATWSISDAFAVTGGLRYYDFEEERTQVFDGIFADPASLPGTVSADGIVPRIIASWKLSDLTTLNAQFSQGFRLGGINDQLNRPLCTPQDLVVYDGHPTWDDEKVLNYEIGSKSTIMGGRGTLNVSAFYMDIEDLQATLTAGSCSSRIILNVPKAHSAGLEFELGGQVTDNFDFSLSASYNESELDSTFSSPAGNLGIKEGNRLPTVPEFQAALAGTYQWLMSGGWVSYITGTYQHIGSRFTQIGDQAAGFGTVVLDSFAGDIGGPYTQPTYTFDPELPAYDLINLRWGVVVGNWDTALFVNNVTDEEAKLALDQERGTRARVGYLTNPPRTIGISTRVKF